MKLKMFGRIIEIKNRTVADMPAPGEDRGWVEYLQGKGYVVNAHTALRISAVLRCVDVVAKTMASLPLGIYKHTEKGRERAPEHYLEPLLHRLPNRHTTAYDFWLMYVYNLMLTRGGFAKIVRDRRG